MVPPMAQGKVHGAGPGAPAALSCPPGCRPTGPMPAILRRRADFLRAAAALRRSTPGFVLQARRRDAAEGAGDALRVGFTCSKKVGNAVERNRARRRLRAVARLVLPGAGRPGWDYVLIGRRDATASRDFAAMADDLGRTLARLHAEAGPGTGCAP